MLSSALSVASNTCCANAICALSEFAPNTAHRYVIVCSGQASDNGWGGTLHSRSNRPMPGVTTQITRDQAEGWLRLHRFCTSTTATCISQDGSQLLRSVLSLDMAMPERWSCSTGRCAVLLNPAVGRKREICRCWTADAQQHANNISFDSFNY